MQEVKKTHNVSEAQRGLLLELINSKDDVIVSLAACTARIVDGKNDVVLSALKSALQKEGRDYRRAFLTMAVLQQELLGKDNAYKIQEYEKLFSKEQGALAIEIAKTILTMDKNKGIALLEDMSKDENCKYGFAAFLIIKKETDPNDLRRFYTGNDKYDFVINLCEGTLIYRDDGSFISAYDLKNRKAEKIANTQKQLDQPAEKKSAPTP